MNEAEKMDEILRLLKSGSPVRLTPEQCAMVLEGISHSPRPDFALEARSAEALDAERYRFLRDTAMTLDDVPSVVSGASGEFDFLQGKDVDEAVDEAITEWRTKK